MLVEGESDAHTLWHIDVPCLGIPGASAFKTAWAPHVAGREVWVHQENDQGGETFVRLVTQRLKEAGHRERIRVFAASAADPACKDLSDLYLKLGLEGFREKMVQLLTPLTQAETAPAPAAKAAYDLLGIYSAADLALQELPPAPMAVDDLVPEGLTLLAGAPKMGKSWMILWLALCVVQGVPFLGQPVRQGRVLYLDIESNKRRTRGRLQQLGHHQPPLGLLVAHKAPKLEEGFTAALDGLLQADPDMRLIIVDTLGRVKGNGRGAENAYEADTRIVGELQRWALDRAVSVVMVHHLRKPVSGQSSDPYERISGSTGITGAADAVLVLERSRHQQDAVLHADGRDISPRKLALRFEAGAWALLSADADQWEQQSAYRGSPLPGALRQLMQGRTRWEGTATQLVEAVGEFSPELADMEPREAGGMMRGIAPLLEEQHGIRITHMKSSGRRVIRLSKNGTGA